MSENVATKYCSKCKCHRPSPLFIDPNRANPFKTCSKCRSKRRTHTTNTIHRKRTHSEILLPSESRKLRPNELLANPIVQIGDRNPQQLNQDAHCENERQISEIEVPSTPYDNTNLYTNNEIVN